MALLSEITAKNFSKYPGKIFFYSKEKSLSGQQCLSIFKQNAEFLKKNEIRKVGIKLKNSPFWPLWYLAADSVSKQIFLINSNFSHELSQRIKKEYDIDLLIEKDLDSLIKNTQEKNTATNKITEDKNKAYKREDIIFTSGTTGKPKGVVVDENAYMHVALNLITKLSQNESDLELLSMPFDHSFGLLRLRSCLITGCSSYIADGIKDFPEIYKFHLSTPLTGISLVPSALEIIRQLLRKKANKFASEIKYMELGSSAISNELRVWLKDNFKNTKILHHYGMTECSRAFLRPRGEDDDFDINDDWVGECLNGCEYSLLKKKSSDDVGELLLKGKNMFSHYLEKEDSQKKIFNGWFKTGDLCKEKENKIFLKGRVDNQINVGGEKVQAEEVERIIEEVGEIKSCICFGVHDDILGNKVACLIEANHQIEDGELRSIIKKKFENYPSYFKPTVVKEVNKIPRTDNGKKIRNTKELITQIS